MSLPIISADERLKETKGIKGCIFGKSGIGKTSLLWTLPAEKTLFFDLEAGDLAIEGWQVIPSVRAHGRTAVILQPLLAAQTRPCVMSSHTAKPIMMPSLPNTVMPER